MKMQVCQTWNDQFFSEIGTWNACVFLRKFRENSCAEAVLAYQISIFRDGKFCWRIAVTNGSS